MKKFAAFASLSLIAVAFATVVGATEFQSINGSTIIKPRQAVVVSAQPGQMGYVVQSYPSTTTLRVGMPVKLVASAYVTEAAQTFPIAVTVSATLGDTDLIGVVVYPAGVTQSTAGDMVDIAVIGSTTLVRVGGNISVTAGAILVQSATAGFLTATSGLTESGYLTNLSQTSTVGVARAIETKGMAGGTSGDDLIRARIIKP